MSMTPEDKLIAVSTWENEFMLSKHCYNKQNRNMIVFELFKKRSGWFYVKSKMFRVSNKEKVISEHTWTKCFRSKDAAADKFIEAWLYSIKKFSRDFPHLIDCKIPSSFNQLAMQLAILGKL